MAPQPPPPWQPAADDQQPDAPRPPEIYTPRPPEIGCRGRGESDSPQVSTLESTGAATQELVTLHSGWLQKGCNVKDWVSHAAVGGPAQGALFRRRFFVLTPNHILYWPKGPEPSESFPSGEPSAKLQVAEIDDVVVKGREVHLHFASPQCGGSKSRERVSLKLLASSAGDASHWASRTISAVAARLREMLPAGWDVGTMLQDTGPARRVAKVELSSDALQHMQHLVDHSFICKRTRDRRGREVPVRLEVEKVVCVQNVNAWMTYDDARCRVRIRSASPDVPAEALSLSPEVLTATLDSSSALGKLDVAANEQWLYHGTTVAAAQAITDNEFRMELAGTNRGSMYGKAFYLAECSSKGDEYSEADDQGLCRMLLCRASLGAILVDQQKKITPEVLRELCQQGGYDSVCGDRWAAVGTFREFVLYDSSQVYPEYIMYYRRVMQGDLLQGISSISSGEDQSAEKEEHRRRLVPHAARMAQVHPDPQVRYRISLLLGAHAAIVVPTLTQCLKDELPLRRRTAAAALGHVADFSSLSRNRELSAETQTAPEEMFPVISAVPGLIECIRDDDEAVRRVAIQAIESIGPPAVSAVPALAASLSDVSEDVRCASAKALEKFGGKLAAPAVPALAKCLEDSNVSVQKAALAALGKSGPYAKPAMPVMIASLRNSNECVRVAAAASLELLGPTAASAVPHLLQCLEDSNDCVRTQAARALGQLGHYVESAAPEKTLRLRLGDQHEGVRAAAATALGKLGGTDTVPSLIESLKDKNEDVRRASAVALGHLRDFALPAVPPLMKCLKDSNEDVRKAAAISLGCFGPEAAAAASALAATLSDTTISVREAAADSLSFLGVPSRVVLAALTERLKDPSEGVRKTATKSLETLQRQRQPEDQEDDSHTQDSDLEDSDELREELGNDLKQILVALRGGRSTDT